VNTRVSPVAANTGNAGSPENACRARIITIFSLTDFRPQNLVPWPLNSTDQASERH
jgi:hypothetical protein